MMVCQRKSLWIFPMKHVPGDLATQAPKIHYPVGLAYWIMDQKSVCFPDSAGIVSCAHRYMILKMR